VNYYPEYFASIGVDPRHMSIGPIVAIPKILAQTGLSKEDIDVWEVWRDIGLSELQS
jgi:acetyl-CoA acetyltransferase